MDNLSEMCEGLEGVGEDLGARLAACMVLVTPNILYIYDLTELRYVFVNGKVTSALGYTPAEICDMGISINVGLVHPEDVKRVAAHHQQCIDASDGEILEIEYRLKHVYGDWHWLACRDTPLLRSTDGHIHYILGIAEDISDRKIVQEKLWFAVTHDQLTGLHNRPYFEEELSRLSKGRRFPITILFADVAGLRAVNDAHGHEAGDELLKRAAEVLKSAFRAEDVVARLGDDEFGVLVPILSRVSTDALLARIRNHLENLNRFHPALPLQLWLGVATAEYADAIQDAVRGAEQRMYDAKRPKT
jgi:diguanylate cyclase (GGDEF)-like protein/PAS domain S-box-containing protein